MTFDNIALLWPFFSRKLSDSAELGQKLVIGSQGITQNELHNTNLKHTHLNQNFIFIGINTMKLALIKTAAVSIALIATVGAASACNLATANQFGWNQSAGIQQFGNCNNTAIGQSGWNNTAAAISNGNFNTVVVGQDGAFNTGVVGQNGSFNAGAVQQSGAFNYGEVVQNGNFQTGAVIQSGVGNTGVLNQTGTGNTALIIQAN